MARQGSFSLGREVRKFVEMTGQGCTHHVPCQSPDTRSPRRFGARFRLYFHAGWLPSVTGVVFFLVSQIVANLATKSGKVFQSTIISHPTCTTVLSTRHRRKGASKALFLSGTRFCSVICPEMPFVLQNYSRWDVSLPLGAENLNLTRWMVWTFRLHGMGARLVISQLPNKF